jgi:hypothetical protein
MPTTLCDLPSIPQYKNKFKLTIPSEERMTNNIPCELYLLLCTNLLFHEFGARNY